MRGTIARIQASTWTTIAYLLVCSILFLLSFHRLFSHASEMRVSGILCHLLLYSASCLFIFTE